MECRHGVGAAPGPSLCPVFTARNTEKMWAQEPTPASPPGAATRSRPPGALHAASAPGASAKPHATNRATRSDPVGDGSPHPTLPPPSSSLSFSSHLPFPPLTPSQTFTEPPLCPRRFMKGCHLQSSRQRLTETVPWCTAGYGTRGDSAQHWVQPFPLDWPYFSSLRFSRYLLLKV